jgi:hypothetical protein
MKIPVGTTLGQMRDVVAKYAEERPNQTNNDFGRFAYNALHEAMNRPEAWRARIMRLRRDL